jgi:hypothetical protein
MVIVDVKMVSGFIPMKASVKKVKPKSLTGFNVMINVDTYGCQFNFIGIVFKSFIDILLQKCLKYVSMI